MKLGDIKFKLTSRLKGHALEAMQKYPKLEYFAEQWLTLANNRKFGKFRYRLEVAHYDRLFSKKLPNFKFEDKADVYLIAGSEKFCGLMEYYFGKSKDLLQYSSAGIDFLDRKEDNIFKISHANKGSIDNIVKYCAETFRKLHIYVDTTSYFKSEDSDTVIAYIKESEERFSAESVKISCLVDSKEDIRSEHDIYVDLQASVNLRVSNHLASADKLLETVQNPGARKVLVPQWFELTSNTELADEFRTVVQQHPNIQFVIFDPIWEIRLNNNTAIFSQIDNVKYLDEFDVKLWAQLGAEFDYIWFLKIENFLDHVFGKVFLLSSILQSVEIVQNLEKDAISSFFASEMEISDYKNHLRLITRFHSEKSFRDRPNFWVREQQLAASVKIASQLESTLFEQLADMPAEVDGPLNWQKTVVLLPTNRTIHRPRIDQAIRFCKNRSVNLCLLFHGKRDADQIRHLDREYDHDEEFVRVFHEDTLGIGGGLNRAIGEVDADIWFKIDDDDDYSETYFREHYVNLRISNLQISSKKDCIYRRKENDSLYLKKVSVLKSGTLATYRTMPGTSMAGFTATMKQAKFPEYSRFALDRETTKKVRKCGLEIFSGSAFFYKINRFDKSMHTSPLQAGFWENHCIELPSNAYVRSD